jgi:hypothetical protein
VSGTGTESLAFTHVVWVDRVVRGVGVRDVGHRPPLAANDPATYFTRIGLQDCADAGISTRRQVTGRHWLSRTVTCSWCSIERGAPEAPEIGQRPGHLLRLREARILSQRDDGYSRLRAARAT